MIVLVVVMLPASTGVDGLGSGELCVMIAVGV